MPCKSHLRYPVFFLIFVTTQFFLSGCAGFPLKKPEPPVVNIASVKPLNLSLTKQKLVFKLSVFNPNPYDVPLESIDFIASLAGKELASGGSDQKVTLPAKDYAFVDVEVVLGIDKLLGQLQSMLESVDLSLGYVVKGHVKVANWPSKIPFNVEGEVNPPEKI